MLSAVAGLWGDLGLSTRISHFVAAKLCTGFHLLWRDDPMSEESDRMMVLLEELAVLKKAEGQSSRQSRLVSKKRRKEISEEMKRLAAQKEAHSQ